MGCEIVSTQRFRAGLVCASISMFAPLGLAACAAIGPSSIDHGRSSYNDVIQSTSEQQTLLNIVRVREDETPLFMDVTEVDAATSLQGSISGGPSNIGASPNHNPLATGTSLYGLIGSVTGTTTYQEAPTVRYQPLTGQPLIAQVSTPLTAESLANLYNSDWPLPALLTLSVDRMTRTFGDYDVVVNALSALDQYGALSITATTQDDGVRSGTLSGLVFTTAPPPTKDNLTIYFNPNHVYEDEEECDLEPRGKDREEAARQSAIHLWHRLQTIYGNSGDKLVLNTKPIKSGKQETPPLLFPRSALGVMRFATERDFFPTFEFGSLAEIQDIIESNKLIHCAKEPWYFYIVSPQKIRTFSTKDKSQSPTLEEHLASGGSDLTTLTYKSGMTKSENSREVLLANARRFILIVKSKDRPENAFVAVQHGENWYSILDDDRVSKKNLALIAQINTIQAIPTQSPPLTPAISVGARQ